MRKVYFLDTVHPVLNERLEAVGFSCVDLTTTPIDGVKQLIRDAFGLVIRSRMRMDAAILDSAPDLRFIARSGAGMENIDIPYCEGRDIQLFNAPEGNRNAVAEHALAMLLMLFNKLNIGNSQIRSGTWDREGNRGIELEGRTVGIIGYGNNGSAFAKVLSGLGVEVLAYDKYKEGFGNDHVKEVAMDEIFEKADVLSLHIPQNDETLWLVDAEYIGRFSRPFHLINLSRGKLVKTDDLVAGLESGKILGACLDVLEYEKASFEDMFTDGDIPVSFEYLVNSDKVILSPHVGGWSEESYYKLSSVLADKILQHFPVE